MRGILHACATVLHNTIDLKRRTYLWAWLALMLVLPAQAYAEATSTTKSDTDAPAKPVVTHKIAVIGDSLAQDLWNGLHKLYRGQEKVEIVRFTKVSTGLVRDDVFDWNERVKKFAAGHEFDIAIVLMGGNDRQGIVANGKRLKRFGKAWAKEYGLRVDELIKTLKTSARAVYWLGLPIVRSKRMARDYKQFNEIYQTQSEANEIRYISTWPLFDTEDGQYTSFGPDAKGTKRRLRKDDGLHFTVAGKLRFAIDIVRIINKDLSAIQSDAPAAAHAQTTVD